MCFKKCRLFNQSENEKYLVQTRSKYFSKSLQLEKSECLFSSIHFFSIFATRYNNESNTFAHG